MCGGSQKSSSSSSYTPSAQASGFYTNVLNQAGAAGSTPYNPATAKTVAGLTPQQQAAFAAISGNQGNYQPSLDQAGNMITAGAAPITAQQIQNYTDPHQQAVIDAAVAQANQNNAVAQSGVAGNAAAQGALGGNRVGVAQGTLAGEQGRNMNSMVSQLLSQGHAQALGAAQNDAQRQQNAGTQFMNLGQTTQQLGMNDASAQLAAGNQQQQQQQNVNDASSANAQQQTMWPMQMAQWLAGIGAGIGPLTGSTSTGSQTTSQGKGAGQVLGAGLSLASMMSDERIKEDIVEIGTTHDGQPIYKYRIKGSPTVQMGLMAQDVEKRYPEAVGENGPSGLKSVNYDVATRHSERFADGGGVPFGSFGGMWNELRPASPVMPQLPSGGMSAAAAPVDYSQSIKLGKSARSGIDNVLRELSPSKGWSAGTSIEPTSGAGKGLSGLFGGGGFAAGGGVDFRGILPHRNLPLTDENIGEIGESGIQPEGEGWGMRGMSPTYGGKTLADFFGWQPKPKIDIGAEAMPTPEALPQRNATMDALAGGEGMPSVPQSIGEVGPSGIQQPPAPVQAPAGMSLANASEALGNEIGDGFAAPAQQDRWHLEDRTRPQVGPAQTVEASAVPGLSTLDFIKQQEGFAPVGKRDGRQISNGYGTRARYPGEVISREEAEKRAIQETGQVENWLDDNITAPMTPGQRTALVSFGFNLGTDDLGKLKSDINAGRWDRVAMRMPSFNQFEGKPLEALTARRLREAALISGEGAPEAAGPSGAPTAVAGSMPQRAAGLVAKGMDPEARGESYAGPKDKKVGGLLSKLFGIEFNPLGLTENERMAVLTAGLSMMSNGDIGGGGLAGVNFLQGADKADRDAALAAAKLQRELGGKWSSSAGGEILVNDLTGEVRESGYEKPGPQSTTMKEYNLAKEQGFEGSFLEYQQATKEARAKVDLPAEVGARIGLANKFIGQLPEIEGYVREWTKGDTADLAIGRGKATQVWAKIESGIDALRRNLTGAGMSASEADNYIKRYQIEATDTTERKLSKLTNLREDLEAVTRGVVEGKSGLTVKEFLKKNKPATGPKVGDVEDGYRFIGGDPGTSSAWEAVQ